MDCCGLRGRELCVVRIVRNGSRGIVMKKGAKYIVAFAGS